MKTLMLLISALLIQAVAFAQAADYKVLFDVTSGDTIAHRTVIRQVKGISQGKPEAKLEVVIYSDAINLVLKEKSGYAKAVEELSAKENVSFRVCASTMKRHNITESQLIPGVKVVPDAIFEIISKQKEGWGYIKVTP